MAAGNVLAFSALQAKATLADAERQVDECAAEVWGLTHEELAAMQRSLRSTF